VGRLSEGTTVEAPEAPLAAGPTAEQKAPAADLVDRCRRHGDEGGRSAEDVDDAGAELDALGNPRHFGEEGEDLVAPRLGHPERVVSELVGELRGAEVELAVIVLPEGDDTD